MEYLKGKLSLCVQGDDVEIELECALSHRKFLIGTISHTNLIKALARQSSMEFDFKLIALECVGKKHEWDKFEFKLPDGADYTNRKEAALEVINDVCPEGWESDNNFSSQDTFFRKGKEEWARCIIRRWI